MTRSFYMLLCGIHLIALGMIVQFFPILIDGQSSRRDERSEFWFMTISLWILGASLVTRSHRLLR